jgi:hypothetical protein
MTIPLLRRAAGAAVLLVASLLASCGDSPTGGDSRDPAQMDVVSGGLQQGVVGEELARRWWCGCWMPPAAPSRGSW